jgi:putative transposase
MDYPTINAHCAYNIAYHIVWCPKRRKPVLIGGVAAHLEKMIRDVATEVNVKIESLAIQPDHVHLFVSAPPILSPHKIVKLFKGKTAKPLRDYFPHLRKIPCMWSRAYYIGTVGSASESVVKLYIENQK